MADKVDAQTRSKIMRAVKGKNTKPEVYFRKLLFAQGYRYSLHTRKVSGHPDVYLAKYHTAIYVNGCFWHQHQGCKGATTPKSNEEFWHLKFENNRKRDQRNREELAARGIKCLVVWECTVTRMKKDEEFRAQTLERTVRFLTDDESYLEL